MTSSTHFGAFKFFWTKMNEWPEIDTVRHAVTNARKGRFWMKRKVPRW
jgi:hypothetical protein